jgi:hypothetical protein
MGILSKLFIKKLRGETENEKRSNFITRDKYNIET